MQPIIVRPERAPGAGYEIVAGERRWRAAQQAGLHAIPVIVRELEDQEVPEFAIIENVQRADLNAIEEAAGYKELIERYGYTQEALAEVIGKSRSHLANTLRLLKLPDSVRAGAGGQADGRARRALIGREDAEMLAHRVVRDDLTVREVEALVQGAPGAQPSRRTPREKDADTRAFEKELSDVLGLRVEIQRGSGESGLLTSSTATTSSSTTSASACSARRGAEPVPSRAIRRPRRSICGGVFLRNLKQLSCHVLTRTLAQADDVGVGSTSERYTT